MAAPEDDRLVALAGAPEVKDRLAEAGTAVYIVRADGHIVWASPSMEPVMQRRPQDLVGRNGWDVFVPPEDLPQVAEFRAQLSDEDGAIWMRIVMPGGGRDWFCVDILMWAGGIVCAFRREDDPALRYPHLAMRPRTEA